MLQVVQNIRTGETGVKEVPEPVASPGHLVIANVASLVSAGTERYVVELAKKSLVGKALDRPDHVRRVLQKVREEGLLLTAQQVRAKLSEPMSLGYSCAGVVLECGRGVSDYKPGDRVASAAPHAAVVSVGKNLCARIPDEVSFERAAFCSVAAIAMQGVRLARVTLGERVLVVGLGLVGQVAVALLKAQGCKVFGTDLDEQRIALAKEFGCDEAQKGAPLEAVRAFSRGYGVDAVLITAATSDNGPIEFAAEACRARGRVVLVGVAGLSIPRRPFYEKELEFTVSSSLGPGRYDPSYADKGQDYPFGQVRWTARRNMEAVLELMAGGDLPVEKLISHRFPIEQAADAYQLITDKPREAIGVLLEYSEASLRRSFSVSHRAPRTSVNRQVGISVVGAGNFARLMMVPMLARTKGAVFRGIASARGLSSAHLAEQFRFAYVARDVQEVLDDPGTHAMMIATRHDSHASLVERCLRAGKHVFVEKPLCITETELRQIHRTVEELGERCPILMVGFNRRFAPATDALQAHFDGINPLTISFRFAAGPLPVDSWPQDEEIGGGRIVGEACHAIDTCTAIAKSPPVRVYAESVVPGGSQQTSDDSVFITLRHENGSISNVSYQSGSDKAGPRERIEVFGGGRTGIADSWARVQLWSGGRKSKLSPARDKGHAAEFAAFVRACQQGGAWPIAWEQLHAVSWASIAAVQSLRTGVPLSIDSELP